jgi:hypothetical protein
MSIYKYNYKDPKDMQSAFKLLAEGEGTFKIKEAEATVSKAGNNMLVITHLLTDSRGASSLYKQYILDNEYQAENMYRICEAIGRLDLYSSAGTDTRHLIGKSGRCKIKSELSEQFGDKSKIAKFIANDNAHIEPYSDNFTPSEDTEDDIPF